MSIASTIIIGLSGGAAVGVLISAGIIIADRVSEYRSRQFLRGLLAKNREFEDFSHQRPAPATPTSFAGAAAASHQADVGAGKATEVSTSFPRCTSSANPSVIPPGDSTPTRTVPACLVPMLVQSRQIRRL